MVVFCLRRWSSHVPSGFLVSRRTPDTGPPSPSFAYGDLALFVPPFQACSAEPLDFFRSSTPDVFPLPVWALPISLATTFGIDFSYFSSG